LGPTNVTSLPPSLVSLPSLDPPRAATVLVVDDDPMVLQAVTLLLEDHGFIVIPAVDGVQGLHLYRKHRPDVVLTDIIMPEKEGIALTRELRREFPDAVIVAMSGGGRIGISDYVTIAQALGADAGLYKPFDDEELVATLRSALAREAERKNISAA
jgi:DNA-binding response OmpR family regulator